MKESTTSCGRLLVGTTTELHRQAAALVAAVRPGGVVALSGGLTPQGWFRWCVQTGALPAAVVAETHFTVSDERCVPLTDPMSNFGHADELLLEPLHVPPAHRHPWAVGLAPAEAAADHGATIRTLAGPGRAYEVCFLGLGEDSHTASLFPGSPLLRDDQGELFAPVEAPGKGWRLTITPTGLRACRLIVVLALGAGKAAALERVLRGPADPDRVPAQTLWACAAQVLWLVDEAAAGQV